MVGIEGNANYEFIELYNPTQSPIELTGWSIRKRASTGNESSLLVASRLEGKTIGPGKYFLAANEEGYTGTVVPDVRWAKSNTLAYTQNAILLYDASGTKIEEVSWTEIQKGQSRSRTSWTTSDFAETAPTPQNGAGN